MPLYVNNPSQATPDTKEDTKTKRDTPNFTAIYVIFSMVLFCLACYAFLANPILKTTAPPPQPAAATTTPATYTGYITQKFAGIFNAKREIEQSQRPWWLILLSFLFLVGMILSVGVLLYFSGQASAIFSSSDSMANQVLTYFIVILVFLIFYMLVHFLRNTSSFMARLDDILLAAPCFLFDGFTALIRLLSGHVSFWNIVSILVAIVVFSVVITFTGLVKNGLESPGKIAAYTLSGLLILVGLAIFYAVAAEFLFPRIRKVIDWLWQYTIVRFLFYAIFYIPCFLTDQLQKELKSFSWSMVVLIVVEVLIIVAYYTLPLAYKAIEKSIYVDGGNQLTVNEPKRLQEATTLGTYLTLNANRKTGFFDSKSNVFNYNYAISFWFYLDALPPNTGIAYNQDANILNYCDTPAVTYNAKKGRLSVTVPDKKVVYQNDKLPLQKWNHMIINYEGGTLDVFLNGRLVASSIQVVPFISYGSLVTGQDGGISGSVANVIYYDHSLNILQMDFLYAALKDATPPSV